jgi:hypothetical protein
MISSLFPQHRTKSHVTTLLQMPIISRIIVFFSIVTLVFSGLAPLHAQDMPIPVRIHVALLKKVFSFNRNFQNNPSPKVTIVFTDASAGIKDIAQKTFTEIGIPVTVLKLDQALKGLGETDVVYVAPGAESIQKICDDRKIFTITGIPALVESGKVAVGIGAEAGKPKVFVNMQLTRLQKQELSSDLLRVARVFQ